MEFDQMDPDSNNVAGYVVLLFCLVMVNAFFAMSEMAMVSINDNKIEKMALEGNKNAKMVLNLLASPTRFLSTIQVGVTISGFLASAVAADTFADIIVVNFARFIPAISESTLRGLSIVIITIVLSYVTLVFGELVPKRVAMNNPEKIAFAVVPVLTVLTKVLSPIVTMLSASSNGILRLLKIDPNSEPDEVTEEEIRMMLDVGNERGNIEESDKHMIHNIFEFDDKNVDDIMTHRTEIIAVDINAKLEDILDLAVVHGYSRIPVYEDDLDDIKGLLYVKDLLAYAVEKSDGFNIEDYLRKAIFIIETTKCKDLFNKFKELKVQAAIVVDEYGGTAGIVTMEDLLEAIVGNMQDEYDDEEEEVKKVSDNLYIVDGLAPIESVFSHFELNYTEVQDEFDTIGGYVLNLIGQIPDEGEKPSVMIENVKFTVSEMDERRVDKLTAQTNVFAPEQPEQVGEESETV